MMFRATCLALTFFFCAAEAIAAAYELQYRQGNYAKAKRSAMDALRENPFDAQAYLYLGMIGEAQNDNYQARSNYNRALAYAKSKELRKEVEHRLKGVHKIENRKAHSPSRARTYSSPSRARTYSSPYRARTYSSRYRARVIRNASRYPSQRGIPQRKPSLFSSTPSTETTIRSRGKISGQAFPGEDPNKFEDKLDSRMAETKLALLKLAQKQLSSVKRRSEERLRTLKKKERVEIDGLVRRIYIAGRWRSNPNYSSQKRSIESHYEELIEREKSEAKRLEKKYMEEADRKYQAILDSRHQLSEHYQKSGDIRLTPKGSSLHVRNYINFNGAGYMPKPKPLRAKAGKLKLK